MTGHDKFFPLLYFPLVLPLLRFLGENYLPLICVATMVGLTQAFASPFGLSDVSCSDRVTHLVMA